MIDPRHPLYNPHAGDCRQPADRREINAVLSATERCYEEQPYLLARYGSRGEAFVRSDGGFLVLLSRETQAEIDLQVAWLSTVLVKRGMPRWVLERHIDLLFEALCAALPSRIRSYRKLERAARQLREARQAKIPQPEFERLAQTFEATSGGVMPGAGNLIVSAVCDEACGFTDAVRSLVDWLASSQHFPAPWCAAVAEMVEIARALIA